MQLEADLLDRPILRSQTAELSALGAAHLAGLAAGVWTNETLATLPREHETFDSAMPDATRQRERALWRQAITRSRWPGPETPTAH
jgi:glycerol kinase